MSQDYKNQIEALLFASGRFMDADTLLQLTGVSNKLVLVNNVKKLKEEYEKRSSPLMVVEEKDGWKLTVREAYLPLVRKIVYETELQKTMLVIHKLKKVCQMVLMRLMLKWATKNQFIKDYL